jgi:MFS transporter, DHA1 family, multidrug resistance protein
MFTGEVAQRNSPAARFKAWSKNNPLFKYPDLGLICLGVFVMLMGVGAIVPVRSIYARDHGATMAELGFMASAFLLGQFLFQLPGGWASDKWGRKPLLVTGVAVGGLISFMFLLNDNAWYFIVLRFIEGLASGIITPAANAYVIDSVPAKERGAAFGWLGSAFSAGFMMGPAIGGIMGDWYGYTSPFIFGGVTGLATAVFMAVKMTNRKPGEKPAEGIEPSPEAQAEAQARNDRVVPRRLFWPALMGALIIVIASGFGDGLFISIWTLWLDDLNASTSYIGLTFITFSLPLMLLMPTTGKMADKYRLAPMIIIPSILISTVYLTYGFTTDLFIIAAVGLLEGTFIALMVPATSAFIANLSPDNARGKLQGVVSTTRTVAGFVSSILVAILYGMNMKYPFYMLAVVQVIVAVVGGLIVWRVERSTIRLNAEARESETPEPVLEHAASISPALGDAAR